VLCGHNEGTTFTAKAMNKNAVVCAIEHVLRDEGCNEVVLAGVYQRVKETRGNFDLGLQEFLALISELVDDGLFEVFGATEGLCEDSLIARSQTHPSVPVGRVWQL